MHDGSARAICPNRRNRLDTMVEVTGGCPVLRLTSSFVTWAEGGSIWIKFRRLVQNDMSTAEMCGNGNQM